MFVCMNKQTITRATQSEQVWRERVQAWRQSGKTANEFAESGGFSAATMRYWAGRLALVDKARFVRLVPKGESPSSESGLTIDVGGARIRVLPGFDAKLLADVVRALSDAPR